MQTILLNDLSIGYRASKRGSTIIADGITGAINSGELTCLLGANGAGKSTLLRTISASLPPISGDVIVENQSITTLSNKDLSRKISIVLTQKPDVTNLTVLELVGLGRSPYTGFWGNLSQTDRQIAMKSIKMVGMEQFSGRMIQTLSDGERQKIMIAKALAQQTPIIILDEPTAFLDFKSKVEIMQLLHRLAHEMDKTIFLSTHDISLVLQVSDKLWLMQSNQKMTIGTPKELAQQGILSHFIEQDGIKFDTETMEIKLINNL